MKLIFCIDDRNGLAFNKRRQSRDRKVIEHILNSVEGRVLGISAYSEPLFEGKNIKTVSGFDDALSLCDAYFEERDVTDDMLQKADSLTIYLWNRAYPGDSFVNIDEGIWKLESEREFAGSSHDKITVREYRK